jgi:hypothetical protein
MSKVRALFLLLASIASSLACGSGRQLKSISISQTVNGQQIQFVATGTFSSAPTTVTPLPVDWTIALTRPTLQTPERAYTLTTQPFTLDCPNAAEATSVVVAFAPPDPNAPASGLVSRFISQSAAINCP